MNATEPKIYPIWAYVGYIICVNGAVVFAAPDWPAWRQFGVALLIIFAMNCYGMLRDTK